MTYYNMKIDYIFFIMLIILVLFIFFDKKTETFADTTSAVTSDQVKQMIREIYLADIDAIRNLSNVATKLSTGGYTVPGNLTVSGSHSTNGLTAQSLSVASSGRKIDCGVESNNTAYIDFNSLTNSTNDRDARIIATGGTAGSNEKAALNINAGTIGLNGTLNLNGPVTSTGAISATGAITSNGLVTGTGFKVGSWTIKENNSGHLVFVKDGTTYTDAITDYKTIGNDKGFVAITQDGNIWMNRSIRPGWLSDSIMYPYIGSNKTFANTNFWGNDVGSTSQENSLDTCSTRCKSVSGAQVATWDRNSKTCWCKNNKFIDSLILPGSGLMYESTKDSKILI